MDKGELEYEIYNKKILAIISAFKEWHHYFEGAYYIITIFSDYQNLEYFATTNILN
jgi:hypothetical protein